MHAARILAIMSTVFRIVTTSSLQVAAVATAWLSSCTHIMLDGLHCTGQTLANLGVC